MNRAKIFRGCVALAVGVAGVLLTREYRMSERARQASQVMDRISFSQAGEIQSPEQFEITSSASSQSSSLSTEQFLELLQLRGEMAQLRRLREELSKSAPANRSDNEGSKVFHWPPQLTQEQSRLVTVRKKLAEMQQDDSRRPRVEKEIAELSQKLGLNSNLRPALANELTLMCGYASSQSEILNPTQETLVFTVSVKGNEASFGSRIGSYGTEIFLPPGGTLINYGLNAPGKIEVK